MDAEGWDKRYADGRQWSVEPNRFFADAVNELTTGRRASAVQPGTALDLATGEGRNAVWLAQMGWRVTAVDFSSVGIDRARAGEAGIEPRPVHPVTWIVADLTDHDLGHRAWDLVTHIYLHWPAELRLPFLGRAAAAVAPGGHLIMVGHDRSNIEHGYGGPQDPAVLTTPNELRTVLEGEGLTVIRAELVYRHLQAAAADNPDETVPVTAIDHIIVARRAND